MIISDTNIFSQSWCILANSLKKNSTVRGTLKPKKMFINTYSTMVKISDCLVLFQIHYSKIFLIFFITIFILTLIAF